MKPAIATVSLGGTLREKLEAIAKAGFTRIELFDADVANSGLQPSEVKRIAADLGIEIADVFPLRDPEGNPGGRQGDAIERAERFFDLAAAVGAPLIMSCSNVAPDAIADHGRIADDLRTLAERAHARGLKLAYEAIAWGRHVWDYRDADKIVAAVDHPALGVTLDTFHVLARKLDVAGMRAIPAKRIALVQISDAPMLDVDYMTWSRHHRGLPGSGAFDLAGFMAAVTATGFDGLVSLECFSDELKALAPDQVARDARQSLDGLLGS